jgi:hypothetical protein
MAGILGGALAAAMLPAAAAAEVEGGCPPGDTWHLELFVTAVPGLDKGTLVDGNGDGFGCYKVTRSPNWEWAGGFFDIWTWMDNTEPLSA